MHYVIFSNLKECDRLLYSITYDIVVLPSTTMIEIEEHFPFS